MNQTVLFALNVILLAVFGSLLRSKGLLGYAKGGKWYLTWLATGVITLMDELTSVFYAPAEAHRFIGTQAIFFIAFTSLLMRFLSSRMVEIAKISREMREARRRRYSFRTSARSRRMVVHGGLDHGRLHLTACIRRSARLLTATASCHRNRRPRSSISPIWGVAGSLTIFTAIARNAACRSPLRGGSDVFVNISRLNEHVTSESVHPIEHSVPSR